MVPPRFLPLWALHTYVFRAFLVSPKLHIKSPEKQCGKTLLLDVLEKLTPRSIRTENLSTAVLFRLIDAQTPTLLVDEADTFLNQNDELIGIINSGHREGGCVLRCEGDQNEIKKFKTFGPLALAGIGTLPGTIEDRSISIPMSRKRVSDQVSNFRSDRADDLDILARKAARWAADNYDNLSHDPEMPAALFNRVADNWRPLFAIADCAGGEWPKRARKVAVEISAAKEDESIRIKLIGDIRELFMGRGVDWMTLAEICQGLTAIEDGPWRE